MGIIDLIADMNAKDYQMFMENLAENDMSQEAKDEHKKAFLQSKILEYDLAIRREAFKKVMMEKYVSYYRREVESEKADDMFPILKEERAQSDEKFKSDYLFITINPRPSMLWPEFMKICLKVVTKPWIKRYLCVFEQRGDNDDEVGKGFHFHLLLDKGDYRWSHARREFVSTFNKVCDTQSYNCFNFTLCKEADLKNRQNYMLEMKADPEKHLKQEYDKKWRKIYNLPEYYGVLFCERKGG